MFSNTYYKNLGVPTGKIDVVLDTDAYNEIDDQFALAYLLKSTEKLNTVAIYAAPFFNQRSTSPKDGMEKRYEEIFNVLKILNREDLSSNVFKGSEDYIKDEQTPTISDAANDLVKRAMNYSPKNPLYVVAIGAITNIASALLLNPEIAKNIVIVWLGGHAYNHMDTAEFNMVQDIAAARVVFKSSAPFVQLPCVGVVSHFHFSIVELEHYMRGKNKLCDFLLDRVIEHKKEYEGLMGKSMLIFSKVIWDVVAVAWLLNDNDRFMIGHLTHAPLPEYDKVYSFSPHNRIIKTIYYVDHATLASDLIKKLTQN